MPTMWGPVWVRDLLASPILKDERDLLMDRRRVEIAMRSAPPPPSPEVQAELDTMAKIDEALARPMPAPPEIQAPSPDLGPELFGTSGDQPPAPPALPFPRPDFGKTAPTVELVDPLPKTADPDTAWPPKPVIGPDGLLHPGDTALGGRP